MMHVLYFWAGAAEDLDPIRGEADIPALAVYHQTSSADLAANTLRDTLSRISKPETYWVAQWRSEMAGAPTFADAFPDFYAEET